MNASEPKAIPDGHTSSSAPASTTLAPMSTSLPVTNGLTGAQSNLMGMMMGPGAATTAAQLVVNATKIVEEFQFLLEKSQQLFAGLRDLPPTGSQKLWQPYFQRTFEIYTKLWKFQQQHRSVLEHKDYYGLKRWEIGEIASKIGQLYYHYYLRTSETNYLYESYIFYEAIRERAYFKDVMDTGNPALTIKKLRYYARYIVVCLLLNRNDILKVLMAELSSLVSDYSKTYKPADAAEWQVVLKEAWTFLEANEKIVPNDEKSTLEVPLKFQVQHRLPAIPAQIGERSTFRLSEALIIGFASDIKFSELTIDMYRMLQSLERDPTAPNGSEITTSQNKGETNINRNSNASLNPSNGDDISNANDSDLKPAATQQAHQRLNPHKSLLFRPTINQLLVYLATACRDSNESGALFVYISSDALHEKQSSAQESAGSLHGYAHDGVPTTQLSKLRAHGYKVPLPAESNDDEASLFVNSIHPGDLVAFSRRPLFVIVEGGDLAPWRKFPKVFSAPVVILTGPTKWPTALKNPNQRGSLFTLFLHSPSLAIAAVADSSTFSGDIWEALNSELDKCLQLISDIVGSASGGEEGSWRRFMADDYLSRFIIRWIFTYYFMGTIIPQSKKILPGIYPALPEELLGNEGVKAQVSQIVSLLGIEVDTWQAEESSDATADSDNAEQVPQPINGELNSQ